MHVGVLSVPGNFHCQKWAGALAAAGAQVTVFTLSAPEPIAGCAVVQIRPVPGVPLYLSYWLTARRLRQELDQRRVDVMHPLHLTPFGSWGLWSGFRPMIPAAMGADVLEYPPTFQQVGRRSWAETEVHQSPLQTFRAWGRWRWFRSQVQQVVRAADAITADNQPLLDALTAWLDAPANKLHLLRWGLEPDLLDAALQPDQQATTRKAWRLPAEARVLLVPRGLNAFYQADVIVQSLRQLLEAGALAGWHIILLGAGYATSPTILADAQTLSAQYPQVRVVTDQLDRHAVTALWGITDAFISAPVYDGYSAAVAEGRYVGAVPIVNRIPGNIEILVDGQTARFVYPFTPESLSSALREVTHNIADWRARVGPPNRDWILQHSVLSVNAQRFLDLAEQVVRKYRAG